MAMTSIKQLVQADPARSWTRGDEIFLTPKEAAATLRVSKSYLDKLRVYGGGPKFLRFGRKILYRRSELNLWAEGRCFGSTSEYEVAAAPMKQRSL